MPSMTIMYIQNGFFIRVVFQPVFKYIILHLASWVVANGHVCEPSLVQVLLS